MRGEPRSRRVIDHGNLALIIIGLILGASLYLMSSYDETSILAIIPSVVAVTVGASGLIKRESPQDTSTVKI